MTITKKQNGTHLEIALEGYLDSTTASELEKELETCLDSAETLTLDLADLEYISSAGLRVVLYAHKIMDAKGGMKVVNVKEIVQEVFDVTGFADVLTIKRGKRNENGREHGFWKRNKKESGGESSKS